MTATERAAKVACPKCGSRKGEPCTYLPLPDARPFPARGEAERRRIRQQLVGSPTRRFHTERFQAASARPRPRLPAVVPQPRSEAIAAVRRYDVEEYTVMQSWLRENVGILL